MANPEAVNLGAAVRKTLVEADYAEFGDAYNHGRLDFVNGAASDTNPHWEARVHLAFQPEKAIEWLAGWSDEYRFAEANAAASTIPVIQHKAA